MFAIFSVSVLLGLVTSSEIVEEKQSVLLTHVKAVINGVAKLPCDLSAPLEEDVVTLVIWYRVGTDSPIYSVDARGRPLDRASHWAEKSLNGRAFFRLTDQATEGEAKLALESANTTDAGSYKCRVDFKKSPTRNSFVNLTVIVPPSKLTIFNEMGVAITRPMVGPYMEGASIAVTCLASGGWPHPKVTWWMGDVLIDESDQAESSGRVRNELVLGQLDRGHAGKVYKCQAVNNDIVSPLTTDVSIDMYLKVLEVRLVGENLSLSAGSEYEIVCQATGSRPPAQITWWKAGQLLEQTREKTSPDGNITVSTLTITPTIEDLGKSLSCRATNSHVPGSAREDTWTLDVHYAPQVTLTLGSNINATQIKEGQDVYFDCSVKANPWVRLVTWKHGGKNLINNASAGIIITNQTLVLRAVNRQSSGFYTCSAQNTEGARESNAYRLDVKYEPQCKSNQQRVYGAARNEAIIVTCEVDSNPSANMFTWSFNNSAIRSKVVDFRTSEQGGKSFATYTPNNEQGYGTLLCWGRNELGPQPVPCVFHIVPAGKPDPPKNCTLKNKTQTSLFVSCFKGFDGGLPQEFTLEVYDATPTSSKPGRLIVNMTSRLVPEFPVGSLEPGGTYVLNVYASNAKGKSNAGVSVKVTTLRPTQQEHRRNIPTPIPTISLLSTMNPLIWISIGVVSGVSLVAITIIIVLRMRGATLVCCCEADDEDTQHSSSGAESAEDPTKLTVNLAGTKAPPQHITDDDVLEMDERNPDVIPLTNDMEQTSTSDLAEVDTSARSWKSNSDLHLPQQNLQYDPFHNFQRTANKATLAYEIPAPIDKWAHQMTWQSDQQPLPGMTGQPQYNIVLNKQNMVFVDPSLAANVQQNPIVFTTVSIDPSVLAPSNEQLHSPSDVPLNPCILLKQNPEALLATIPENLQVMTAQGDRTAKLYNTLPSKARQQNAETQTPLLVRHKESAV